PAGIVTLQGGTTREDREEMMRLARHQEAEEKREHPLNRIISIEEDAQAVVINTTGIHLPRRIGEAVKRAFRGNLEEEFEKDGYCVRVNWRRKGRQPRARTCLAAERQSAAPPDASRRTQSSGPGS